jgi:hypothetical protein
MVSLQQNLVGDHALKADQKDMVPPLVLEQK